MWPAILKMSTARLRTSTGYCRWSSNGQEKPAIHPFLTADTERPPDAGRRDTRAAASAARTGAILARLHDRTGRADDAQGLPCAIRPDRGERDGPMTPKAFNALFGRIGARAKM